MNARCNIWLNVLLCAVLFARCQDEANEISFPGPDKVFSSGSPTAVLIERTILHDGSFDNILDHASCISLKLPVSIRIKNETIQLNIKEDISALLAHPDKDKIRLRFPVTAILADYTEVKIPNQDKLNDLIEDCTADHDVECTDFDFPITVYSYDRNNQLQAVHAVGSDQALYMLLKNFGADDLIALKFPFHMLPRGGNAIEIDNNIQLEEHILSFEEGCDEGDEADEPAGDMDDFEEVLTEQKWYVSYFNDHDDDETSDFNGYEFDFKSNGTVKAKKGFYVDGFWHLDKSDRELSMMWEHEDSFNDIEERWDVFLFSESKIILHHDESILIFEKK